MLTWLVGEGSTLNHWGFHDDEVFHRAAKSWLDGSLDIHWRLLINPIKIV
jgi:hypothetical protein